MQVKQAVEELYDIEIIDINTMIYAGKKMRGTKRGYIEGKQKLLKAIVTLKEGQIIDL